VFVLQSSWSKMRTEPDPVISATPAWNPAGHVAVCVHAAQLVRIKNAKTIFFIKFTENAITP
jgi:hypothetical protein